MAHAGALGPWRDDPLAIDQASPLDALADTSVPQCSELTRRMVQMSDRPDLYTRITPDHAWGSPYLVDLLVASAEEMAILLPDADPFAIGDVSKRGGGPLMGHVSHQQGVDVDIGMYTKGGKQNRGGFVDMNASNIDYEANWLLIKSMLDSGRIEFILLDRGVIKLLKNWTIANGRLSREEADQIFPAEGTPRLWERHGYVRHAESHRDHLHVRVQCNGGGSGDEG